MNRKPITFRRLGPGTILMLAGVVAAAAYSSFNSPSAPKVRYFEADASGSLREVEKPSIVAVKTPPLFKPEPKLLLEAEALELTEAQRTKIEAIQAGWDKEKSSLESALKGAAPQLDSSSKTSVAKLNAELGDYSSLSRRYDAARAKYWTRALEVLSARQKATFEKAQEAIR